MSNRDQVIEYLTTKLATVPALEKIKIVKSVRNQGELSRDVLIVKTDTYRRLSAAPITHREGTFTLTLVSRHRDVDLAENALDDYLELLLPLLISSGLIWTEARQVAYDDTHLAFDITITSILS